MKQYNAPTIRPHRLRSTPVLVGGSPDTVNTVIVNNETNVQLSKSFDCGWTDDSDDEPE